MKKIILVLVLIALIPVLAYVGMKGYRRWAQQRLVTMARNAMAARDLRNASISAQRAIQSNPNNLPACLLMAELSETAQSPHALFWRTRVAELAPNNPEHLLSLAQLAIAQRELPLAHAALSKMPSNAPPSAVVEKTLGMLAGAERNLGEAEAHFQKALSLAPQDDDAQFNLAIIQSASTNSATVAGARQSLLTLAAHSSRQREALRQLAQDAVRQNASSNALQYADRLLQLDDPAFGDRILKLEMLDRFDTPSAARYLATLKPIVHTNAESLFQLTDWLLKKRRAEEALQTLRSSPDSVRTNYPVPVLQCDALAALEQWDNLLAFLDKPSWGNADYFRQAIRAQVFSVKKDTASFQLAWRKATALAGQRPESLAHLCRFALQSQWLPEATEILWTQVNSRPTDTWAVGTLNELLHRQGDTRRLNQLYAKLADLPQSDARMQNNLAMTYLLLDPRSERGFNLAREAHQKQPNNPYFLSTHAFALHLRNQTSEGLNLFRQLESRQLDLPPVAMYYGIVMAAGGDKTAARKYLDIAEKAQLLPEEAALVKKARASL